jgi:hypothetical protein
VIFSRWCQLIKLKAKSHNSCTGRFSYAGNALTVLFGI